MIILISMLCSFILITLGIIAVFNILTYNRISRLLIVNGAYQAEEYRNAVASQKVKKPIMKAVKQDKKGRDVTKQEEYVDISDLDFETGYQAIEEAGR